jgi:transposase-like protein
MSKYTDFIEDGGLTKVTAWTRDGLINEQIAKNIGITLSTLYEWKKKYKEFSDALKKGKEVIDIEVENALYKKALGYNAVVKKTFKLRHVEYGKNGNRIREYETLEQANDEVHVPADTTAQIFWLKNRKPADWRDKQENIISSDNLEMSIKQIQSIADLVNKPTEERKLNDFMGEADDTVCTADEAPD